MNNRNDKKFNRLKQMAKGYGFSIQRFTVKQKDVAVINNEMLVWLSNLHWKELGLQEDYIHRDYGGWSLLDKKLYNKAKEKQMEDQKFNCPVRIKRSLMTDKHLMVLLNKAIS